MNLRLLLLSLASATAWTGCSTQAVNALSSDVGPDAGATLDVGTFDSGQGAPDVRPPDLGLADGGFADGGGGADANTPDFGPAVCAFPDTFQDGPAIVTELPEAHAEASVVLRAAPEQQTFLVTWLVRPGLRTDEPAPVARYYGLTGEHLTEQNIYGVIPAGRIFDTGESEPGFNIALAEDGRVPGGLIWNELGAEHAITPAPAYRFGQPTFFARTVRVPEYPVAPGPSGHPELLRLHNYDRTTGAVATTTIAGAGLEQGFEGPRAVADGFQDLWLGVVQDFFLPAPVAILLDPVGQFPLETIVGHSCSVLTDFDLLSYEGNAAILSDCGGSEGGTHVVFGRGSFRAEAEVFASSNARVPSRIGFNGRDLAVVYWEGTRMAPTVRFFDAGGQAESTGGIRLPVPVGLEGAEPVDQQIVGISGELGGFDPEASAWGVGYSYREQGGEVRTFFARLGPCGTSLPR